MNRTVKNRDVKHPKPVKKIELSEKHSKARFILAAVLALIGVGFLVYSFMNFLGKDTGWTQIKATTASDTPNCSSDFEFQYHLGAKDLSATAENKLLVKLYTEATTKAYQIFHENQFFADVHNIFYINSHPNEIIEVDEVLYNAFELLAEYGNRNIYLSPIYADCQNLFYSLNDEEALNYDAYKNQEIMDYFTDIAGYARDSAYIDVQLLGENQIRLYVSDEYLQYADEIGFTNFIDFYWMKNAFIIDYIAEVMLENQFTQGIITSVDGFVRNLDDSGQQQYSYGVNDRVGLVVYDAATMQYRNALSLVNYRNYPVNAQNDSISYYYMWKNGEISNPFVDINDGLCKTAINDLIVYSYDSSCSEILLKTIPVYIAESMDYAKLQELMAERYYSVYCKDYRIYYNDSDIEITDVYENEETVKYTVELIDS